MPVLSYFTLPFGQPIDVRVRVVPEGSELLCDVLSAVDTDGAYQLYQCVEEAGQIYCVVPVCRVRKPLMLAPLKVYLDTSAISYLQQDDSEEKTTTTRAFWEAAKSKQFQVYLSDITLEELSRCPEPKRSTLFDFLQEVTYTEVTSSKCVGFDELVLAVNNLGILPKRSIADISHIATAICMECDVIASWNFKHMSNPKTVAGVRTVTLESNRKPVNIMTPAQILEVYL